MNRGSLECLRSASCDQCGHKKILCFDADLLISGGPDVCFYTSKLTTNKTFINIRMLVNFGQVEMMQTKQSLLLTEAFLVLERILMISNVT